MIWNNGQIQEGTLSSYPSSSSKNLIYEVIRVVDNAPVFLHEHLARFWKAWGEKGSPLAHSEKDIIKGFFDVIRENNLREGNMRLQLELEEGIALIGIIPHHYPGPDDYLKGVRVDLLNMQRSNPNIKSWNERVRKLSDEYIRTNNIYEVILTSEEGFLLEGSRSNIFGFQKGILKTPPVENVLPGITRQKILEIAVNYNIPIKEEPIHQDDIYSFQSFFLTGTSPGILPINSIGNIHYNCKSMPCDNIRKAYAKEIKRSIKQAGKLSN